MAGDESKHAAKREPQRPKPGDLRVNAREPGLPIGALLSWWLWMPLVVLILWLVSQFVFGKYGQQAQDFNLLLQQQLWPYDTPLRPGALLCLWLFIGMVGTVVIFARAGRYSAGAARSRALAGVAAGLAVAALGTMVFDVWDSDKDLASFYDAAATFYVPSLSPAPSSLLSLVTGDRPSSGRCDAVGGADVPACIRVEAMPAFDFEPRTASLEGAVSVMTRSSALASQVNVMTATMHYLPGPVADQGRWTAVLDGSGTRPMEGVTEWDGQQNAATVCEFGGDDKFDRAFAGIADNSLRNLLARAFPDLVYSDDDVSGYCQGSGASARPVVVIAVERQLGVAERTALEPAGVLVLTGSPSGNPSMTYDPSVRPGQFPTQVYPQSAAAAQVDALDWSAGRGARDDAGFGYELAGIASNEANPGEYVLRSQADGHLYFVTPLTPRNSSSQAVVAYAVERADESGEGLNPLSVYVLPDSADPPSLSVLESRITTYINQTAPGLLSSGAGGRLDEIIPFGQGMWRGFLDVDGLTQDYIDLSGDASVQPRLVTLQGSGASTGSASPGTGATGTGGTAGGGTGTGTATTGPTAFCGDNPATLTPAQIAQCIQILASALAARDASPGPSASAAPPSAQPGAGAAASPTKGG